MRLQQARSQSCLKAQAVLLLPSRQLASPTCAGLRSILDSTALHPAAAETELCRAGQGRARPGRRLAHVQHPLMRLLELTGASLCRTMPACMTTSVWRPPAWQTPGCASCGTRWPGCSAPCRCVCLLYLCSTLCDDASLRPALAEEAWLCEACVHQSSAFWAALHVEHGSMVATHHAGAHLSMKPAGLGSRIWAHDASTAGGWACGCEACIRGADVPLQWPVQGSACCCLWTGALMLHL